MKSEKNKKFKLIINGHQHRLKLIPLTTAQRKLLEHGGLTFASTSAALWASEQEGEVFEGFFEEIHGIAGDQAFVIDPPEFSEATQTRHGKNLLVWFESNHKTLFGTLPADFNLDRVEVVWEILDLDDDSQKYCFCSFTYPGIEFDEELRGVDEGFFLVDRKRGIMDIEVEENDDKLIFSL